MERRKLPILCFINIFTLIIITFCGCIVKNIPKSYSKEDASNIITYNIGKVPESLSIAEKENLRQQDLFLMCFEGLVISNENGTISPGIADSWKISKDGITYTFKLREDAYFSDGSDINAEDFVDFFSQLLKMDNKANYNESLDCIFGVKEYREGKRSFQNVAIRAKDSKTLQIILNKKNVDFLNILSEPNFCLRKFDDNLAAWKKQYKKILYSGPYCIWSISKGGTISLIKNDRYWGRCKVKCQELHLTTNEVPEAAMAAFDSGNIDIAVNPPKSEVERLNNEKSVMYINKDKLYKRVSVYGIYYTKSGNIKLDRAYKLSSKE